MNRFLILLFVFRAASAETHSMKIFFTGSSGFTHFPEFEAAGKLDSILAVYCDKNVTVGRTEWLKELFEKRKLEYLLFVQYCSVDMPAFFKHMLVDLKQHFKQTEGAHVFQRIAGCGLDENTKSSSGFLKYGYDAEDFIEFDLEMRTWVSLTPQADFIKQIWDADAKDIEFHVEMLTVTCPLWLNLSLSFGNRSVLRTDYPSVSLLQRTPSSPVRCHATGFYPTGAQLFWRKDGQETVKNREIFPNDDDTFQLHVDLDVSSLRYEDWSRYDCVFQFSGVEDKIIIKLEKAVIRTNWDDTSLRRIIITSVVLVLFLLIAALGFIAYKKRTERRPMLGYESFPL